MKKFILIIGILMCLSNCKEKEEIINIEGYTKRNELGEFLGQEDVTDWGQDDELPTRTWQSFEGVESIDLSGTATPTDLSSFGIELAYPNPAAYSIFLQMRTQSPVAFKYIIVDESFSIYYSKSILISYPISSVSIPLEDIQNRDKLYRIYYTFSAEGNENFYYGHGDVYVTE